MTFVVTWGGTHREAVTTAAQLDTVLDRISATGRPHLVGVYPPQYLTDDFDPFAEHRPLAMQLGVGHPSVSFVILLGTDGGTAAEPQAAAWPAGTEPIEFDYAGEPVFVGEDRARVSPATARQAAREFVATGTRPGGLVWEA